jgi:enoyl-CoA hydratase/carnithine racemase
MAGAHSSPHIRLEQDGPIATLTLARPEKRNALTPAMLAALQHEAERLRTLPDVRAVLLVAEGPDFSVGADLAEIRNATRLVEARQSAEQGARTMRALLEIPQPTIAVHQGIATGGGACLLTACDHRIAHPDARLGYGEVKIGIPLMWNALAPLVALVGPSRAKRLVLSGALFPAATLEAWGLLDELSPDPLATARAMAQSYAALPPVALQMARRSITTLAHALGAAILHADTDQFLLASRTADAREALAAFREKRPATFSGD